jgi:3,4-dihydroxy 2-butanone 4-phosphate synthase/GTP cyclohydrolase II
MMFMGMIDAGQFGDAAVNVERALAALRMGRVIALVEDQRPDAAGWLAMSGDCATAEAVSFMAKHSCGVLQSPIPAARFDALHLPVAPWIGRGTAGRRCSVGVSCRGSRASAHSAHAVSETLRALADAGTPADAFSFEGDVFPTRVAEGGVLATGDVVEAAGDLSRLAGRSPAAVLAAFVTPGDGANEREQFRRFAESNRLPVVAVSDVAGHRFRIERLVEPLADAVIPTRYGDFLMRTYRSSVDGSEHVALICGTDASGKGLLVRVHSECLTGDVFGSARCDCGAQLDLAMARIADAGRGAIVYLRGHEGRGIGLSQKLRAYRLQDAGRDTVQANEDLGWPVDSRDYGYAAQVLRQLGADGVALLSNNPAKAEALRRLGISVDCLIPLVVPSTPHNARYLAAKRDKLGHTLPVSANP